MSLCFAKRTCDRLTENADFGKTKFIFSDEAHFDLVGCGNKQNCCIWGTENTHVYIKKPMHPKRVMSGADFPSSAFIRLLTMGYKRQDVARNYSSNKIQPVVCDDDTCNPVRFRSIVCKEETWNSERIRSILCKDTLLEKRIIFVLKVPAIKI